jgi:molybdate transport system substrate-binding protein
MNFSGIGYFALMFALCTANIARAETISVFAAASLGGVMRDISDAFFAETGDDVIITTAGSSTLARQIENGAPADVFVSANAAWAGYIEDRGLARQGSKKVIAKNRLVLVTSDFERAPFASTKQFLMALKQSDVVAMAMVDAVPAGIYGKSAFINLGVWDQIEPHVVQSDSVSSALRFVAMGEAQFGVVYGTDAFSTSAVKVVYDFPSQSHDQIEYPALQITDLVAAENFMAFLSSQKAAMIMSQHGFIVSMQSD